MKKFDYFRFDSPQKVENVNFQRLYLEVYQRSHLMYLMLIFEILKFYLKSSQKHHFDDHW